MPHGTKSLSHIFAAQEVPEQDLSAENSVQNNQSLRESLSGDCCHYPEAWSDTALCPNKVCTMGEPGGTFLCAQNDPHLFLRRLISLGRISMLDRGETRHLARRMKVDLRLPSTAQAVASIPSLICDVASSLKLFFWGGFSLQGSLLQWEGTELVNENLCGHLGHYRICHRSNRECLSSAG